MRNKPTWIFFLICLLSTAPLNAASTFVQVTSAPWAPSLKSLTGLMVAGNAKPFVIDWEDDGDQDILLGSVDSKPVLFINDGDDSFTPNTLKRTDGEDVSVATSSCPAAIDWDADGDNDLMVGDNSGYISYFENNGQDLFASAVRMTTSSGMDIDVGQNSCPTFADWEGDGDTDLIIGASSADIYLYTNNGSNKLSFESYPLKMNGNFFDPGSDAVASVLDWDEDGDMDLILGESDGTLNLYENDGSDIFTETTNYKSIDVGEASAPFVVDWHDDGDLDILVGSDSGGVTLYQNSGMYRFTSFTASLGTRMDVGIYSTPATADYDADGDTDLVVGEFDGGLELFINKGTGTFETATALTMTTGAEIDANIPAPDLIDWSSDGDFDVLVGAGDGTMTLFKNNGADVYDTGTKLTDTTGATIDVGHYAVPQYTDWDGDGDQDVVVGHAESLALLTNNGSNKFTVTDDLAGSDLDSSYHSPAVVDWNDDGVKDLILASYDGKIRLYLNDGSSAFNSGTVLTDEDSVDIDVGQQARLAVTDWDSDGYKDMIVGSVNGKVYLFLQDADADGYVGDDDCNNKKSTIYDDATETCGDGVDQDCDGSDTVCPATTACGDGIISTGETCDDANTVSNDGCSAACLRETAWYLDSDGDRYGDTNHVSYSATRPTGYAKLSTDCDDSNNAIYPTATETCNDLDDDCNDIVDDATVTYYADADNDRYGDTASPVTGDCDQPSGTATLSDDCNDADGLISPGALDIWYDGIDSDCRGDSDYDQDGDGYDQSPTGTDCSDTKRHVSPGLDESCTTTYDDNCDGLTNDSTSGDAATWYADADGDGYGSMATTQESCAQPAGYVADGNDCDDASTAKSPGQTEICGDGIDQDCNGSDAACSCGDGMVDTGEACDDGNSVSADSCSSSCTNEIQWYADADGDGSGNSGDVRYAQTKPTGYVLDGNDCNDTDADISPDDTEVCDDGTDQDCDGSDAACSCGDGMVDTGEECDDGNSVSADSCSSSCTDETQWYADADGDLFGNLSSTKFATTQPRGYVSDSSDCDDSAIGVNSLATEICGDGTDQDCDGSDSSCPASAACGNDVIESGENCDDGNTSDGDGCSASCLRESSSGATTSNSTTGSDTSSDDNSSTSENADVSSGSAVSDTGDDTSSDDDSGTSENADVSGVSTDSEEDGGGGGCQLSARSSPVSAGLTWPGWSLILVGLLSFFRRNRVS